VITGDIGVETRMVHTVPFHTKPFIHDPPLPPLPPPLIVAVEIL
jgi:hypothetical protein